MSDTAHIDDRRTFRIGMLWNYAGSGTAILAQILYTAVTARLIFPSGFGAYAAAQVLASLMGYFTFTSLGNAVLRSDLDRHVVGTALWMSAMAGFASISILVLLAPTWGELWESPQSIGLVYILSLSVLFSSLSAVPMALVRNCLLYTSPSPRDS